MVNEQESDFIVQSWIKRKTALNCVIKRKVYLKTAYEWYFESGEKDITRGIVRKSTKTSYSFIPTSKRDFGRYRCTIRTASSVVEHTIELQQIGKYMIVRSNEYFHKNKIKILKIWYDKR